MKTKISVFTIILILLFSLSGCSFLTGRSEELVEEYNTKVENTLILYNSISKTTDEMSENIMGFLSGLNDEFVDKGLNIEGFRKEVGEDYLIQKNKLFTSMDSNYVKQVLLLYNNGTQYYYEILWTTEGVESITGRVI